MIRVGTCHFRSVRAARSYFRAFAETDAAVAQLVAVKIAEGEIRIGRPALRPGERMVLVDGNTRYAIEEQT